MFWKRAKKISITTRMMIIYLCSMLSILSIITALIYPPLLELLQHAKIHHQHYDYLLTEIYIKKFFIGLWLASSIAAISCFFIIRHSLSPLNRFSCELDAVNASALHKRINEHHYPNELKQLADACNAMISRVGRAFQHTKQFSASMAHELKNPVHYLNNCN